MFVYNRCTADARVLKEARTLTEAGHRVRIVAVLDSETPAEEEREGFRIVRIDRNPVHYRLLRGMKTGVGMARRRLPFAFLFAPLAPLLLLLRRALLVPHKPLMFGDYYWRAYRLVRADPPDALHAHDLNTLPVAAALARRLGLPLVYDAHELYPEISTLSPREAAVWRRLERRLARARRPRGHGLRLDRRRAAAPLRRWRGRPCCSTARRGTARLASWSHIWRLTRQTASRSSSTRAASPPTADWRRWSARRASWSAGVSC